MTLPRTLSLLPAALLLACVPPTKPLGGADSEDGGDDGMATTSGSDPTSGTDSISGTSAGSGSAGSEGSEGSEGGMESTGSDEGTTTDDPDTDGGSTGEMCEEADCAPCDEGCELEQGCVDGEWECNCICPPQLCDFEEVTCETAEFSKVPPLDCGVATLDDDLQHWQDVHACVQEQASMQAAFKGVFYLQGIDSFPRRAYVGQIGFVYALSELFQDYGGLGDPQATITQTPCLALSYIPDCQVGVGFTCLQCLNPGDPQILCQKE